MSILKKKLFASLLTLSKKINFQCYIFFFEELSVSQFFYRVKNKWWSNF
jgi:hypothetical protein